MEAALLNTTPCPVAKSSASDFAPQRCTGSDPVSATTGLLRPVARELSGAESGLPKAGHTFASQHWVAKVSLR